MILNYSKHGAEFDVKKYLEDLRPEFKATKEGTNDFFPIYLLDPYDKLKPEVFRLLDCGWYLEDHGFK